jgi:hypothetical protein
MRPNHSTARPTQLIVVTVETSPVVHPDTGLAVGRKLLRAFAMFCRIENGVAVRECGTTVTNPKFFWEWVCKRLDSRRTTWIVGNNIGASIQALGLFPMLDSGFISLDYPGATKQPADAIAEKTNGVGGLFVVADPPTIIGIRSRAGSRATIVDTRNYVDATVDELSEFTNHKRCSTESGEATAGKLVEQLARDSLIVRDFVLRLLSIWKANDFGMFRWTIGGLAMSAFRHRFMPHPPELHNDKEVKKLERASYRGGEIICNFIGRVPGPAYQVDITSLYPHVMRTGLFPVKLINYVALKKFRAGRPPGDPCEQIAEVALDVGTKPFSLKTDDGTMRVSGRFTAYLCGQELESAVRSGSVIGWRKLAIYKLEPLFRSYVDGLWPLRKKYQEEGNKIGDKLIKGMLVSLYGKFGQFGYGMNPRPDKCAPREWQQWQEGNGVDTPIRNYISIGRNVFQEVAEDNNPNSSIAIAAFVTSAGRSYMESMRDLAGDQNVMYQSCDSLIVNSTGLDNLHIYSMIGRGQMGLFRVEESGDNCVIDGSHDYSIGDKKIRGWRSGAAIEVGEESYIQTETESLRRACRHTPTDGFAIHNVSKKRRDVIEVGRIGPGGWTYPIRIDWGNLPLPDYQDSDIANDSPNSSILAAMSAGATGGDCSTANTTDFSA